MKPIYVPVFIPPLWKKKMPTFQCKSCGRKIEADYETCECTHSHNCHLQKNPVCCGKPMLEIIDDWKSPLNEVKGAMNRNCLTISVIASFLNHVYIGAFHLVENSIILEVAW